MLLFLHRDAPEPTGEEGEDVDLDMPRIYEPVNSECECGV